MADSKAPEQGKKSEFTDIASQHQRCQEDVKICDEAQPMLKSYVINLNLEDGNVPQFSNI